MRGCPQSETPGLLGGQNRVSLSKDEHNELLINKRSHAHGAVSEFPLLTQSFGNTFVFPAAHQTTWRTEAANSNHTNSFHGKKLLRRKQEATITARGSDEFPPGKGWKVRALSMYFVDLTAVQKGDLVLNFCSFTVDNCDFLFSSDCLSTTQFPKL